MRHWAFVLPPCKQPQLNTCLHPLKGNCRVCPVLYSSAARPEQWVCLVVRPIMDGESSCLQQSLCTLIAGHLFLFKPNILNPTGETGTSGFASIYSLFKSAVSCLVVHHSFLFWIILSIGIPSTSFPFVLSCSIQYEIQSISLRLLYTNGTLLLKFTYP